MPSTVTQPSRRQLLWATLFTGATLLALGFWSQLTLGGALLPHAFCISAAPSLLTLHLASDGLIAFAYLLIPWAMLNFVRKRGDIPFGWIVWVFGAFIVACGFTHAFEVWTLYYPVYWLSGVAKAFTAVVSLGTAWLLYRLTPLALAVPSAADLQRANAALRGEVQARERAERELAAAHAQLQGLLRKAQGEVRTSSAVLDRFFDEAPLGLCLLGADGRVLRVNARLTAQTGRTVAEYLQTAVPQLPGVPGDVVEAIEAVRLGHAQRRSVQVTVQRQGEERFLQCTMFAIPVAPQEDLVGAVVDDVTAQEQLAAERARTIAVLQEADRRKDDFIAMLAHELRNPLAPIATATHLLVRSEGGDPARRRPVEIIQRQVGHMRRLLDDLLDVSRIVHHTLEVRSVPADLGSIAGQVAEDLRGTLEDAGTRLELSLAQQPLPVAADPVRIAQAVGNYLHNAARFAAGKRVRLSTFADHGRGEAVVRVEDDGPGIEPPLLQRLFEPFTQGQQDLARSHGGLGLGLALARGIAELHGGRVRAESDGAGHGAAFELRLPLVAPSPGSATAGA